MNFSVYMCVFRTGNEEIHSFNGTLPPLPFSSVPYLLALLLTGLKA